MRIFKAIAPYEYREQEVIEVNTNKKFVLTQRHGIFNEDTYTLSRFIACESVSEDIAPEGDFYIYKFAYIQNHILNEIYLDEKTTFYIIKDNLISFIQGSFNTEIIKKIS
jgi:hypothetical protein